MKKTLLFVFCLLAFPLAASHIVGGEFEILYVSGNTYRINLILYFDQLYGNPGAKDPKVSAAIYRKRDNAIMAVVVLPLFKEEPVSYTQPACSKGEIVTTKITYTRIMQLSPNLYNDPEGYYIVWERCCRNYTITNIYSQDPNFGGIYAGQTFYLEFPPVVKDGVPFINSSPRLFPPLNDYACPYRPYYVDFAGVDDDGDSLVYSLVTPLNTRSGDALPPGDVPRPAPYPPVMWRGSYGIHNIIGGNPDLQISSEGFLTVTPTTQGLFVFAVKCEEYRDGKKIGEVRRDFQMLVVDRCADADPPEILGKTMADGTFIHKGKMTVTFPNTVADDQRCIQVQVSDPDASKLADSYQERIQIKARPVNFKGDVSGILPPVKTATLRNGSTQVFNICFDECPFLEDEPFQIDIIAYDDACSLPLSDTLRIIVNVEPPENSLPYFTTADVTEAVNEGEQRIYAIEGLDDDLDELVLTVLPGGFHFADVGMTFEVLEDVPGSYKAQMKWDAQCSVYDFSEMTHFEIKMLLEDSDRCLLTDPDTMVLNLDVILPHNNPPEISISLTPEELENGVSAKVFESIDFTVSGTDADNDGLLLRITDPGKLNQYGGNFPEATGTGNVTSPFEWLLECDKIKFDIKNPVEFTFVVSDEADKCNISRSDTLKVKIKVEPPDNTGPVLSITSTNPDLPFINLEQTVYLGQQISLDLVATDADTWPDQDKVSIALYDASGTANPTGYNFEPAEGKGYAQTTFTWNPDCSIFENGIYENQYTFKFRAFDDRCFSQDADTVVVNITLKDIEVSFEDFIPPNIFTPDNDPMLLNEFFAMVKVDAETGELLSILPEDNCAGRFVSITIYNRWGKEVFASEDRNFKWYAEGQAAGVYFYLLKFTNREFKGAVTVRN